MASGSLTTAETMAKTRRPLNELALALSRSEQSLAAALYGLLRAVAKKQGTENAREVLGREIVDLVALADIMGRRRVVLAAKASPPRVAARATLIPFVSPADAIADIVGRHPTVLEVPAGLSADEAMGLLYRDRGFSLAKLAEEHVISEVQSVVARALEKGLGEPKAAEIISDLAHLPRAYSTTVVRNNVNTAYTSGIFEQMKRPGVQQAIGALTYAAIGGRQGDGSTTPRCMAFHGTVAPADHAIWASRSTPTHHGCRSSVDFMTWPELRRRGMLDSTGAVRVQIPNASVRPADGFGGRGFG